jgi:hypothetical protein
MTNTLPSSTLQNSPNEPWWKFSITTWLFITGLVLLNIGCFLRPFILDAVLQSCFNLLDFRTWPWWYFLGLITVLGFSVRWFLLYQKHLNDEFDLQSSEECKWFCWLSGTITLLLIVLVFLHRLLWLPRFYYPLYFWFGYGNFSFEALLIFATIFVIISVIAFLVWRWATTLPSQ